MSQRHCSIRLDIKGKIAHFVLWDTVSHLFLQMSNRLCSAIVRVVWTIIIAAVSVTFRALESYNWPYFIRYLDLGFIVSLCIYMGCCSGDVGFSMMQGDFVLWCAEFWDTAEVMEEDMCKYGTGVQSHVGLRTVDDDRQHYMCQIIFIPVLALIFPTQHTSRGMSNYICCVLNNNDLKKKCNQAAWRQFCRLKLQHQMLLKIP